MHKLLIILGQRRSLRANYDCCECMQTSIFIHKHLPAFYSRRCNICKPKLSQSGFSNFTPLPTQSRGSLAKNTIKGSWTSQQQGTLVSLPPVPFKTIHISPWWTLRSVNTGSTQWKLTSKIGSERGGNRGTRTKPVTPLGSLTSRQGERDAAFWLPGVPLTPRRCPWALPACKEWLRQPPSPKPSGIQHIS